jgi:hypothetical protein
LPKPNELLLSLNQKDWNNVHAPSRWQKLFAALLLACLSAQSNAQETTWNRLISSAKQEGKLWHRRRVRRR